MVTTPESLFILLTAESSRRWLADVRTVIVDEIHAVAGDKRGAHLALSLERLAELVAARGARLQRIGLSATVRPIQTAARLLVGADRPLPEIVNVGQRRDMDLAIEVLGDELGAVCTNEQWEEIYDRVAELARAHRSTLVFVNTRRLVERVTRHLAERLGAERVAAHHSSLSRQRRFDAEQRLKAGKLSLVVATASLELGIDVGTVDLTCLIGSPRSIATALQRVGRSGHALIATPKGRLFPLTRDQLVECAALVRAARRGEIDRLGLRNAPLDVLAQQIVAICACEEQDEDALFDLCRRAAPYAALAPRGLRSGRGHAGRGHRHAAGPLRGAAASRRGGATAQGPARRAPGRAHLGRGDPGQRELRGRPRARRDHHRLARRGLRDRVHGGRRHPARQQLLAHPPDRERPRARRGRGRGALHHPVLARRGAGAHARAVRRALGGAAGRGRSPARSGECDGLARARDRPRPPRAPSSPATTSRPRKAALGAVPTRETVVVERFFDEAGGMQLVVHAPFGGRINRAWGMALRKRLCHSFNFELQAAATDDGVLLSLGPQHSFPLEAVFEMLHPSGIEELLIQAALQAPMFNTRWRWNANRALALLRWQNGRKVPPYLQRMRAEDLLVAVFPEQLACQDNAAPGPIEVPDHPLVRETLRDCLTEAMDIDGLRATLTALHAGEIRRVTRETPEPSVFAHEILNANPYAFLDDAPLEERRARAVTLRRGLPASVADDVGRLDPAAITAVVDEAWPDLRNADELHDLLLDLGALPRTGGRRVGRLSGRADRGRSRGAAPPRPPRLLGPGRATLAGRHRVAARSVRARPDRAARAARGRVDRSGRRAGRARAGAARSGGPHHRSGARDGARRHARRGGRGAGRGRGRGQRAPRSVHARGHRGRAGRVVRAPAAGAHPPAHPRWPAPAHRAGVSRRAPALPAVLAARAARDPAARPRRPGARDRAPAGLRGRRGRVGAGPPARARGGLPAGLARRALPLRRGGVGPARAARERAARWPTPVRDSAGRAAAAPRSRLAPRAAARLAGRCRRADTRRSVADPAVGAGARRAGAPRARGRIVRGRHRLRGATAAHRGGGSALRAGDGRACHR